MGTVQKLTPEMENVLAAVVDMANELRRQAKTDKHDAAAMAALVITGIVVALRADAADADELRLFAVAMAARVVQP